MNGPIDNNRTNEHVFMHNFLGYSAELWGMGLKAETVPLRG
jgi:hypothetical protein